MPYAVVAAVLAVLCVLAFVFERDPGTAPAAAPPPAPVAEIATRVERDRGLSFARTPAVERVTPARARAEAAASLDADYPPARRRAEAETLALLGLIPPGFDLGKATLGTFDAAVAGYYDPRAGSLRVIDGAATGGRVLYETTVAHELVHALEDEVFRFDLDVLAGGGDRALAYTALVEGTATVAMLRYMDARFGAQEALGASLASGLAGTGTGHLPPFLAAQLVFPYTAGQAFVAALLEAGGGRWAVADAALRFRPPSSTEQVLHPEKYLRVEEPRRVRLPAPPPGWRPITRSTLGEWQTAKLLARGGGTSSARAAAGWGGDAYVLFGRGSERALVARWIWDTPADAAEFRAGLQAWGEEGFPDSVPAGDDAWRGRDGAAAIAARGDAVTLAIAPDLRAALALARAGR